MEQDARFSRMTDRTDKTDLTDDSANANTTAPDVRPPGPRNNCPKSFLLCCVRPVRQVRTVR